MFAFSRNFLSGKCTMGPVTVGPPVIGVVEANRWRNVAGATFLA